MAGETRNDNREGSHSHRVVESVLKLPNFRRFWLSRLCGSMASQMQGVAVGWQVYDMTQRPLDLGWVGLAQFLPALLLTLVTGQVADHYDRRRVLAAAALLEGVCAVLLLTLTIRHNTSPQWIFLVLFIFGVARAFSAPASFALVSTLVAPAQFPNAAAWNSTAWQTATIAGPALGGLLYAFGPAVVYSTCTVLLTFSALMVTLIRVTGPSQTRRAPTWASVLAGVTFIRTHPLVLGAISLDLFAVLLGGATALLPIYARDILQVGPWGLGLLRSAPAVGALLLALFLVRNPITKKAGPVLLSTVAVFGFATIGFALSQNLWLSLAMLFVLGAADMVSVVIRRVLIQVATPDEMRGRVSAVESVFIGASNELGEFESGVTAALFGPVPAAVLGGVGTILIVALWSKLFPDLRNVDSLESVFAQSSQT